MSLEDKLSDVELMQTTDHTIWAKEFVKRFGGDEDLMASWFASAMMAKHDSMVGPPNGDAMQYQIDRAATQRAPVEQGRNGPSIHEFGVGDAAWAIAHAAITEKWSDTKLGPEIAGFAIEYEREALATAPDHAREGALRMFVWTKSPSWAAVVLAEHVSQARTLLLEEIGSSGDGSCPEREAAAKWVKERTPVIWRGPNAEFALTDSAELREQEFHSEKLQRRVKELERALADGKEGGE